MIGLLCPGCGGWAPAWPPTIYLPTTENKAQRAETAGNSLRMATDAAD
jgi:hypothetical protein